MTPDPHPEPATAAPAGEGPWRTGLRRLRRNRAALAGLGLFVAILLFVLAAPLWSEHVAETGPNATHTTEKVTVDGERREVVSIEGEPIGPLFFDAGGRFFLGADGRLGRDEMVRLMYGGRTSLTISFAAGAITTVIAILLALLAGYHRGWVDSLISRLLDLIWSIPVILLGIALGVALAIGGLQIGPVSISGGSLWIPILIVGFVIVPYMARPLRGEILALREQEFVEAAIAQGAGPTRVMFGEILPNLWPTIIVFFALTVANNMLLESALSFLGAGVQAPDSSWGTMVGSGVELIYSSPLLVILPGTMIFLTALSLVMLGEGARAALDPKSKALVETHAGIAETEEAAA